MLDALVVQPGSAAGLEQRDPRDTLGLPGKEEAGERLAALLEELSSLQVRLYAEGTRSVLVVLQGLDASGKDGTIRRVFTGVNPQGCRVTSFKPPTPLELAHDFLWRIHAECPARGMIGIFNRSHYEDVVTVGVLGLAPEAVSRRRANGSSSSRSCSPTKARRCSSASCTSPPRSSASGFAERLTDPAKRWKHDPKDEELTSRYDEFTAAYEEAITVTSTESAPWYVIPADRNWVRNVAVATVLVEALRKLDPQFPDARS